MGEHARTKNSVTSNVHTPEEHDRWINSVSPRRADLSARSADGSRTAPKLRFGKACFSRGRQVLLERSVCRSREKRLLEGWYELKRVFGNKYRWIAASASSITGGVGSRKLAESVDNWFPPIGFRDAGVQPSEVIAFPGGRFGASHADHCPDGHATSAAHSAGACYALDHLSLLFRPPGERH